jgi:hypothetical protein
MTTNARALDPQWITFSESKRASSTIQTRTSSSWRSLLVINPLQTTLVLAHFLYPHLTCLRQAEVFAKVEELFKDAPDLSSAFRDFLPGAGGAADTDSLGVLRGSGARTTTPSGEHARAQKRKQPAEPAPASASAPAKRRRRAADRDKEKERDAGRATGSRVSVHDLIIHRRLVGPD